MFSVERAASRVDARAAAPPRTPNAGPETTEEVPCIVNTHSDMNVQQLLRKVRGSNPFSACTSVGLQLTTVFIID